MKRFVCLLLSVVFGVVGYVQSVSALTISPTKIEMQGDPGQTLYGEIELYNEQEGERTFYLSAENFEPRGESSAPFFIGAKDGLATWFTFGDSVDLLSGERKVVPFSLTIPENADPGGYFSAVFFSNQPVVPGKDGEVFVGGKIGVLILLRVSGDVSETVEGLQFRVQDDRSIWYTQPESFTYRLTNTGGDRIVPRGLVSVRNMFGREVVALSANVLEGNILPNSARSFQVDWSGEGRVTAEDGFFTKAKKEWNDFHFGRYTAELNLSWGYTNQTAKAVVVLFFFPWHLLVLVGGSVLLLGVGGYFGIRHYNRWIISKAMSLQNQQPKSDA